MENFNASIPYNYYKVRNSIEFKVLNVEPFDKHIEFSKEHHKVLYFGSFEKKSNHTGPLKSCFGLFSVKKASL